MNYLMNDFKFHIKGLIYSKPSFPQSGGIIVLHKLVHLLNNGAHIYVS